MKHNSLLIIILITVTVLGAVYLLFISGAVHAPSTIEEVSDEPLPEPEERADTRENVGTISESQGDLSLYTNTNYGFSFAFQKDWSFTSFTNEELESGLLVGLQSPDTAELIANLQIPPDMEYSVLIWYWPDINNKQAHGSSWKDQREYENLEDFFTDALSTKQKIGDVMIGLVPAHEVIIGGMGSAFGVMAEHNGIYQIEFPRAHEKAALGEEEKAILDSFTFLE